MPCCRNVCLQHLAFAYLYTNDPHLLSHDLENLYDNAHTHGEHLCKVFTEILPITEETTSCRKGVSGHPTDDLKTKCSWNKIVEGVIKN